MAIRLVLSDRVTNANTTKYTRSKANIYMNTITCMLLFIANSQSLHTQLHKTTTVTLLAYHQLPALNVTKFGKSTIYTQKLLLLACLVKQLCISVIGMDTSRNSLVDLRVRGNYRATKFDILNISLVCT